MTNKKHISQRLFKLTGAAGMAIAGWTACSILHSKQHPVKRQKKSQPIR